MSPMSVNIVIMIVGGLCAVVAITMLVFGDYDELGRFTRVFPTVHRASAR